MLFGTRGLTVLESYNWGINKIITLLENRFVLKKYAYLLLQDC